MKIRGRILDWQNRRFFNGELLVVDGRVSSIFEIDEPCDRLILPGLIDSHVHIESSMLMPSAFSRLAAPHGTVAVVADPHEIANVMGVAGVDLFISDSKNTPVEFYFGAPSCVPATSLDPSGAVLDSVDVANLLSRDDIWFLSEMMNFPGVLNGDHEVLSKIATAKSVGKPVDGHAPGLRGSMLDAYCSAGMSTDHESFSMEEALEKISNGMMIQIREGSAAKNFEALWSLLKSHSGRTMLCTDDCHPDELIRSGHIDRLVRKALAKGVSVFDLVFAASVNPVMHYHLPIGLLRQGDRADFIVVDSLESFRVLETYISGEQVYANGQLFFPESQPIIVNHFIAQPLSVGDIAIDVPSTARTVNVIEAKSGELITDHLRVDAALLPDFVGQDILKLVVFNRYETTAPSVGYIKGIGLRRGAIASSVAHDSHHLIAVGCSDEQIVTAINTVIRSKGGIVVVDGAAVDLLPLPIGGIISDQSGEVVALKYEQLDQRAKQLGSTLDAPFMTLSFMSLLVIPNLKLGSKGLFDVTTFSYIPLFDE
jgi:adenine deaminase